MSSAPITPLPPRAAYTAGPVYRFTVDQWHDMIDAGTLTADDPVELVEGVAVFKMPKNPPHVAAGRRLRRAVEAVLPPGYFYDAEQPIALADGEPEPDGMVVRGLIEEYDKVRVRADDVLLVMEIADATIGNDRGSKRRSYARAGIPFYWIVNLVERRIEVYTDPDPVAEPPRYRHTATFGPGETVPLMHDGNAQPIGIIAVDEVLPPA